MAVDDKSIRAEGTGRRILLTGDIDKALVDAGDIGGAEAEVCANMLDAIDAAAKGGYAAVGVVMAGQSGGLGSALKALRQQCEARIVLLAQMSEEPEAIRLVAAGGNGPGVVDDYLICPIHCSELVSRVLGAGGDTVGPSVQAGRRDASAGVDAGMEDRVRQLERLATEDDLTGMKNRRYIWEFARQVVERADRTGGQVTLLVFDVDNLKHYNDIYGHAAGDEILRQAAVLIRRCCRGHDVVGRIGGDEFAVIFWDDPRREAGGSEGERRSARAEHPAEAISIAKRFVQELGKAELDLLGPEGKGVLAISGGLATYPRDGSTIEEIFEQADRALLEAKRSGKNRIYLVGQE